MFDGFLAVCRRYREAFSAAWAERDSLQSPPRQKREADFLPAILEIQESPPPPLARGVAWLIIAFFLIAVAWMILGKIDIVATAPGKIIPDDRSKVIQATESGVVREILVRDGDAVTVGDALFTLDKTATEADMAVAKDALRTARLEEAMTQMLAAGVNDPSALRLADVPLERVTRQQQVWEGLRREQVEREGQIEQEIKALRWERRLEEQGILDMEMRLAQEKEIARQQQDGEQRQIAKLEQLLPLAKEEFEAMQRLYEDDVVSLVRMRQSEEKYISLREDLSYRRKGLEEMRAAAMGRQIELEQETERHRNRLSGVNARLVALEKSLSVARTAFAREMEDRREQAAREVARLRQEIIKLRQAHAHHHIVAPVSGVVQQMALHTKGGVVQAGQALLVIVPERPALEVEAMVENKDIGFVSQGQNVEVKIDAFSYTKYGLINGVVSHLSADAIEDEKRGLVYQARIRLLQDSIVAEGKEVELSPGMSVVAEVKTGERRVIEFFLSPLLRHGKESMGER